MLGRSAAFACIIAAATLAPAWAQQSPTPAPAAEPPAATAASALSYTQPIGAGGVKEVQDKLNAAGYSTPIDGTWSDGSDAALRSFQQARGLQPTGQMNQATAATLGIDLATLLGLTPGQTPAASAAAPAITTPAQATPARSFSLSDSSIRMIQSRLGDLGFYRGSIDGVWGGGSQSALVNFQGAHGLPADGRITEPTVRALGIDPATLQPQ